MNFGEYRIVAEVSYMSTRETLCVDSVHHAWKGKMLHVRMGVPVERRVRRRRRMFGELACDSALSAEDEITRIIKGVLDRLNTVH